MVLQSGTINIPYGDETLQINLTGNDPIAMAFRQASDLASIAQYGFQNNDQAKQDYLNMVLAFNFICWRKYWIFYFYGWYW